jgi:hypothetical protein
MPDGRVQVLDLLTDRTRTLTQAEFDADPTLQEGVIAEHLRAQAWASRTRPELPVFPTHSADLSLAAQLPAEVCERWREAEPWRRLMEARLAGERLLRLPGFTTWRPGPEDEERLDTDLVHAHRTRTRAPLFEHPAVRHLMGAVLGLRLEGAVECNRWRMQPGDGILAHRVGRRYAATFTLGLNQGWTAADAGAIAFGDPATGEVQTRWLPHAGDVLVFAGGEWSWHWVEAPGRERHTLTGWWTF